MKWRRLLLGVFLAAWSGCSDSRSTPECPASFTIGERCPAEGMKCTYPGGRCGSFCYCVNEPGGFVWDCPVTYCRCTCPCEIIAVNTCEALECRQQEDPCPASAAAICALVCRDAGVRDGGGDVTLRDSRIDGRRDSARDRAVVPPPDVRRDTAPDARRDARVDAPADARRDAAADARVDGPADGRVDRPTDQTRDRPGDRGGG